MNLHPRRVSNKSNVRPETDIEGRRKQRKEESLNVKRFFISFGDESQESHRDLGRQFRSRWNVDGSSFLKTEEKMKQEMY